MKVLLLAGGLGTRLAELTHSIPKPMAEIGGIPIIHHIMSYYALFGHNEFVVALGYKGSVVKDYFLNLYNRNSDFTINLSNGLVDYHSVLSNNWKVTLVDTGLETMTGGRIKALSKYFNRTFFLTYGDGLSNVDLDKLLEFHYLKEAMITLTSVNPTSRYGRLNINSDSMVDTFDEKPKFGSDWINGGFMVAEPQIFSMIEDSSTIFEHEPLSRVASMGKLAAFKHYGFWQCMDTLRDKNLLDGILSKGNPPWLVRD